MDSKFRQVPSGVYTPGQGTGAPEGARLPSLAQAAFILSATDLAHFPSDDGSEIAFVGRSNAGKSSAINALTKRRSLARTSKTPGRTQQINFFGLGEGYRLVDLPGYGYAKVPLRMKQHWKKLIDSYLRQRLSLRGLVIVVDIRRALSELDKQILGWCLAANIPAHVLLTKADKLSRNVSAATLRDVQRDLLLLDTSSVCDDGNSLFSSQIFSAIKKSGITNLEAQLMKWFTET